MPTNKQGEHYYHFEDELHKLTSEQSLADTQRLLKAAINATKRNDYIAAQAYASMANACVLLANSE